MEKIRNNMKKLEVGKGSVILESLNKNKKTVFEKLNKKTVLCLILFSAISSIGWARNEDKNSKNFYNKITMEEWQEDGNSFNKTHGILEQLAEEIKILEKYKIDNKDIVNNKANKVDETEAQVEAEKTLKEYGLEKDKPTEQNGGKEDTVKEKKDIPSDVLKIDDSFLRELMIEDYKNKQKDGFDSNEAAKTLLEKNLLNALEIKKKVKDSMKESIGKGNKTYTDYQKTRDIMHVDKVSKDNKFEKIGNSYIDDRFSDINREFDKIDDIVINIANSGKQLNKYSNDFYLISHYANNINGLLKGLNNYVLKNDLTKESFGIIFKNLNIIKEKLIEYKNNINTNLEEIKNIFVDRLDKEETINLNRAANLNIKKVIKETEKLEIIVK